MRNSLCGTIAYLAPEILKEAYYDYSIDVNHYIILIKFKIMKNVFEDLEYWDTYL